MTEFINNIDMSLSFNESTVRVFGTFEEPLFVVKDVCDILGLTNTTKTLEHIDEEYSHLLQVQTSSGVQNSRVVTEPGLYQIIMRCRKELAKPFQKWVCGDVLPSLRKKGEYKMKEEYQTKLEQIKLENEKKDKIIKDSKKLLRNNVTEIKALRKLVKKQKKADDKKAEIKNLLYLIQIGNENKLGKTSNFNNRYNQYKNHSPPSTEIEVINLYYTPIMTSLEQILLFIFDKYRYEGNIKQEKKREWINLDVNIIKEEMNLVCKYIDEFVEKRREIYDLKYLSENNSKDVEVEDSELKSEDAEDVKGEIEYDFVDGTEDTKKCEKCLIEKNFNCYRKSGSSNDGYQHTCIECINPIKTEKECAKCHDIKSVEKFTKFIHSSDGLSSYCCDCDSKRKKDARKAKLSKEELEKENKIEEMRQLLTVEQKVCINCMVVKNKTDFSTEKNSSDGYRNVCRLCRNNSRKTTKTETTFVERECKECNIVKSREDYPKKPSWTCKECSNSKSKEYKEQRKKEGISVVKSEKQCIKCKVTLSIDKFYKNSLNKDGTVGSCKDCLKSQNVK